MVRCNRCLREEELVEPPPPVKFGGGGTGGEWPLSICDAWTRRLAGDIYLLVVRKEVDMGLTAKVFMHGRSQAVRLPKECRFEGKEVNVTKIGDTVILTPVDDGPMDWALIDSLSDGTFMSEGREQPPMPDDDDLLEFDP
jgi:antitoxin VapB